MRTVAIINQKGGCGKTTTSINLAACLARLGNKTLLVDMDPQGHCGVGLAVPEEQIERTIYDCLIEPADGKPAEVSQIVWQIASDFDLAPSNIRLAAFEQVFSHRPGREDRLRLALDRVKNNYPWCIIDCPPSVGLITFNALKAADQVIVPVETGYFSLHGLAKMMETLELLRRRCGRDILIRILPTLYDTRTKLAREVLSELRARFKQYLMESTVNFNTKLKEAASFGQPITEYDPGSRGYKDFVNLARELMGYAAPQMTPVQNLEDQKLSRPAELVQRARQLAQLASAQFGRPLTPAPATPTPAPTPTITPPPLPQPQPQPLQHLQLPTPAVAETPKPKIEPIFKPQPMIKSEPVAKVEPVIKATPAIKPEPVIIAAPAIKAEPTISAQPPIKAEPIISLSSPALIQTNTSAAAPATTPPAVQTPAAAPNVTRPPRLTSAIWPPASELMLPNRHLDSISIPRPLVPFRPKAAPPLEVKTTNQKIEEFYGVKQIGGTVVFAAHFEKAQRVMLAGDFNNWTPQTTPMVSGERPGDWRKILPLPPGRYKYRLVVDGKWVTDPNNHRVEANQFGELDNIIEVGHAASAVAA